MEEPKLIEGGLAVDDRGTLSFINDFDFAGVKRFYLVENHRAGFVRAWHGHRREAKHVVALAGSALVATVRIDDWEHPSASLQPQRFVLSAKRPSVLYIPPGYANGFMSLSDDTKLMFLSNASIAESRQDDVRFDARYWDVWAIQER